MKKSVQTASKKSQKPVLLKALALTAKNLENLAQQEIFDLTGAKSEKAETALTFSLPNQDSLLYLAYRVQSLRRLALFIGKYLSLEDLSLSQLDFPWKDYFSSELSIKIEVEGVKGQEARLALAKTVATQFYHQFKKQGFEPKIDLRHPDILILVYFNGKEYFVGLDLLGKELDSRSYRLFTGSTSMKGDLAYYLIRASGFQAGQKLVIALMKDGTWAIEAALFAQALPVQSREWKSFTFSKLPCFRSFDFSEFFKKHFALHKNPIPVFAFDTSKQNLIAARKNAYLAGVKSYLDLSRYALEDLDLKFSEKEVDCLLFWITKKDEDLLNEIYHQASYILKPKGTLLLLGRKDWGVSVSEKFTLLQKEILQRGESYYQLWLLGKK